MTNRAVLFRYVMYKLGSKPLVVSNKRALSWIPDQWSFRNIVHANSQWVRIGVPEWFIE